MNTAARPSKSKKRLKIALLVALPILLCAVFLGNAIFISQSAPAYWLFRSEYALAGDKPAMLQGFRQRIWNHGGGHISEAADTFLCRRLKTSPSQSEVDAIIGFYISLANGRETMGIVALDSATRQRAIGSILRQLNGMSGEEAGRALFLAEQIRSGTLIMKGGFYPMEQNFPADWWEKTGRSQVEARYRAWWNANLPWPRKLKINPLRGSGIEAQGL